MTIDTKPRESAVQFWAKHGNDCLGVKSIKEVFGRYKGYCEEKGLPVLNEYIFRTFIRKPERGKLRYNNSKKN